MKVLFVCSGNAHRSPLAEALLKKMRPDLEVDSAGLRVAIPISEEVKKYLTREDALNQLKQAPETLASKDLRKYDLIVAMQQGHRDAVIDRCPECRNRVIVWNVEDPYFMTLEDSEKVYAMIKLKVEELAKTL
jgi:protein-tyrosine phosphatase